MRPPMSNSLSASSTPPPKAIGCRTSPSSSNTFKRSSDRPPFAPRQARHAKAQSSPPISRGVRRRSATFSSAGRALPYNNTTIVIFLRSLPEKKRSPVKPTKRSQTKTQSSISLRKSLEKRIKGKDSCRSSRWIAAYMSQIEMD